MTAHELARKLLAGPDLPVYRHAGDYGAIANPDAERAWMATNRAGAGVSMWARDTEAECFDSFEVAHGDDVLPAEIIIIR